MPSLEHRRIYRSSKSSCAITLPSGWLRYQGLKAGDVVEVVINSEVIIRPQAKTVIGTLLKGIDGSKD